MERRNWTREELIAAINIYCKLTFGQLHHNNPDVISLSKLINRTPSSVTWKLANYAKALKSDNDGMVESAIFHSMKYKLYHPEQNISVVEKQIEKLVDNGKSQAIRYKAYLASEFMQNETLMSRIKKADYKDAEEFFKMLSEELSTNLLAVK